MSEADRYTVGVFEDLGAAERALAAFAQHEFPLEWLSVLAVEAPGVAELLQKTFGAAGETLDVRTVGTIRLHGPFVAALQGSANDLAATGIAAAMPRVGFQAHDGYIYETLTARGGVLVAVQSEPRAADAVALLLAYGGGNAASGAWTGRV